VLFALVLILSACAPAPAPTSTPTLTPTLTPTPQEVSVPTETPALQGKTIVVENTEDSGIGSFRAALNMTEPYDMITFDPEVFKPDDPAKIVIFQPLPELNKEHLTIDASNAGVILDGNGGGYGAFSVNAKYITIQGLHIINFNGTAITLWENTQYCNIGGAPQNGVGPLGQGNLITGNRDGIIIQKGGSHHTIAGNQIGVEFIGLVGNTYSGI
jgi:hypothetical protein